jgi:hypothetical protein
LEERETASHPEAQDRTAAAMEAPSLSRRANPFAMRTRRSARRPVWGIGAHPGPERNRRKQGRTGGRAAERRGGGCSAGGIRRPKRCRRDRGEDRGAGSPRRAKCDERQASGVVRGTPTVDARPRSRFRLAVGEQLPVRLRSVRPPPSLVERDQVADRPLDLQVPVAQRSATHPQGLEQE